MDPGTAAVIAALIGAGGQAAGGIFGAMGQSQSNKASGRQAAQMDPFIEALTQLGDHSGLRGAASRELTAGSNMMNAQLSQRGIYNSGAALQQQRALSSDVFSDLAQAINQDEITRLTAGAQLIGNTPGYGYFDRQTGETRGK